MAERSEDGDGASTRNRIIREATELFLTKGYAATSMSALARVCGIQKASLYHHFPSKQSLFVACATDGYAAATRVLREVRDDASLSHTDRMRKAFDAIYDVNVSSQSGRLSPIIAETSRQIPEVARAFHDGFITEQHDILAAMIDAGVRDGVFVEHDRLALRQLIFGPVVMLSLSREMFASFDTLDELFPVDTARHSHCDMILKLLTGGQEKAHAS